VIVLAPLKFFFHFTLRLYSPFPPAITLSAYWMFQELSLYLSDSFQIATLPGGVTTVVPNQGPEFAGCASFFFFSTPRLRNGLKTPQPWGPDSGAECIPASGKFFPVGGRYYI